MVQFGLLAMPMAIVVMSMKINAFAPSPSSTSRYGSRWTSQLFMGKKKKPSMAERRKRRSRRTPSIKVERPSVLDELPPVDAWEKPAPTEVKPSDPIPAEIDNDSVDDGEADKTVAKASSLVESQRKSVDCLTFIRKRVEESFPIGDAAKALVEKGYFVYDGFLSSGSDEDVTFGNSLVTEMTEECFSMLANDKLERDITRLIDGEYVGVIVGGERYADCPRLTEYVVSLTRHLPPLLNNELVNLQSTMPKLDATASMGTLRVYDRKTRLGAETLLSAPSAEDGMKRAFGVICGDGEDAGNDSRRLTAMLFLSAKDSDANELGGGVTVENEAKYGGVCDRMILLRSDSCSHRQEPWKGNAEDDKASCVTVHFLKETV